MRNRMQGIAIGIIIGIIISGTAVFAATYQAQTATFPIYINGQEFKPEKPAMAIEGSTYLALKDIGKALGVGVSWNGKLSRVEIGKATASTPPPGLNKYGGKIKNYYVEVIGLRFLNDYNGNKCVVVKYNFTNNDSNTKAFAWSISDKVFQNGIELSTPIMIEDINHSDKSKEIMTGKSIQCEQAYILSDESDLVFHLDEWVSFGGNNKITFTIPYSDIK